MRRLLVTTGICLSLSSCASLPQSVTARDAASMLSAPPSFHAVQPEKSRIANSLMDVFADDTLEAIVERSLEHNLDIRLARHRMAEAGFNADAELGDLLPNVTGNFAANRSKEAEGRPVTSYNPSLDVSWEIDIWGKLRSRKKALDATSQSLVETYQATRDSIAAQVMQGWFDVATAKGLLKLEQNRLINLEKSAENSRRSYRSGLGPLDDLSAVERDIAQNKATITANAAALNSSTRSLEVLIGNYPSGTLALDYELPALLPSPAVDVPATLLVERPDLRSAWHEVISADESVNVAHKEMFISLTLTGSIERQSTGSAGLSRVPTIWSLVNQLSFPIFNAGKLKNNMNAAHSRAEQAWVRYLQTALRAFREVEHALDRETLLADQEARIQEAAVHAEKTALSFENRYKNGLVSILEYLNSQNAVFDIKVDLLNTRNGRLKNRVTLALALGKGV